MKKLIIDIPDYNLNEVQNGSIASNEILKAVRNGIPYEPKGDLISREALKANMKKAEEQADTFEMLVEFYEQIIDNAPTVAEDYDTGYQDGLEDGLNDIRPTGEWINHRNDTGHNIADCSLCGKATQWHDEDEDGIPRYCWHCGADMRGGAE